MIYMTNEEAIKILKNAIKKPNAEDGYIGQALTMAIQALEQPCEDCISREQALKAFAEECVGECGCCEYNGSGYDSAENCKLIKSLPSVTPQQKMWIPVSERLPESSGVYIVSRWFSDGCESRILTDACYFDGTNIWHNDIGINHSRDYLNEKIVAWMSLPEPYKAESEDKE